MELLREYRIKKTHSNEYQIEAVPGRTIRTRVLKRARQEMRYKTELEAWVAMKKMASKYKHWMYKSYPEFNYPTNIKIWISGYN